MLGVAQHSLGQTSRALETLQAAHHRHPRDRELLGGLIAYQRDAGNLEAALHYARTLLSLDPSDPELRQLVDRLEKRRR